MRLATLPGVPGICAFLLGAFLVQRARKLRKLNETLEWNNRSLRGIVCDRTGVPIPKATVDVFVEDSQGRQPVTSVQTDAHGRFSANLPEGQYLLEVGAPELGESSIQVGVSKPGTNAELQIKLELTRSTA
ncbi:MAG TPA: carboxypeptidase-like regulatory domain-containing protein [Terracidiphilus sp.]|nr:carboxypeptidase-like regulatory domain-containing protein [Terracidiphilus sp.]